jgi:hypothetical protein
MELSPSSEAASCVATFYGTRKFITVFTRALHWSLSWAKSIQSILSHPISLRSILIRSTHLHLDLPTGLFPSSFPTSILYAFLVSHSCYMPCPSWLDHCNYEIDTAFANSDFRSVSGFESEDSVTMFTSFACQRFLLFISASILAG